VRVAYCNLPTSVLSERPRAAGKKLLGKYIVIDRRSFLAGASATHALGAIPADADDAPIALVGRGIRIGLDGRTWLIDPEIFDSAAAINYSWFDAQRRSHSAAPKGSELSTVTAQRIELKNAHYPGFSLRADFDAALYQCAKHGTCRLDLSKPRPRRLKFRSPAGAILTRRVASNAKRSTVAAGW
jgi:hypothetical protein